MRQRQNRFLSQMEKKKQEKEIERVGGNTCILLTKREVKMAGYWPRSLFAFLWDRDEVEVHKNAKRERGQYPAILTELAWSIKDLLYGIPRLHVALCFYFCVCRFLLQNVFLKLLNIFCFLCFHSC